MSGEELQLQSVWKESSEAAVRAVGTAWAHQLEHQRPDGSANVTAGKLLLTDTECNEAQHAV